MKPFRSALASSFTSLALVVASAGAADPRLALRMVELESQLAKDPGVYLYFDPAAPAVEVRVRGLTLETVKAQAVTLLDFQPLFGGGGSPKLAAPGIWKVAQGPGDTDRETIAPTTLKPYSEDEEKEEPAKPGTPGAPAPTPPKKDEFQKPSTYRVQLDNGWQLFVTNEPPKRDIFHRYLDAVRDGWQRLRGEEPKHPPLLTLVLAPADAQRLHHLFRTGTQILVAPLAAGS
jgi:hypothetical protein